MMSRQRFRRLIRQALRALPEEFRCQLQNVEFVIEDRPDPDTAQKATGDPAGPVFGLYTGIPLTQRGSWYGNVLPDKITLYREPILAWARDDDDLARIVRETVYHEIGHYFGFSEEKLQQIESGWYNRPRRQSRRTRSHHPPA